MGVAVNDTVTYYDAHIPESYFAHGPGFVTAYCAWLEQHGINTNRTHRVEHLVIDAPLVRVFQVDHDEDGHLLTDPVTGGIAYRAPFDVLIRTPPPKPEDYQ